MTRPERQRRVRQSGPSSRNRAGREDATPTTEGHLLISEVFGPTIQGEGPAAGQRAVFVRLGGCPVGCTWCDTAYSWDPKHKDDPRAPRRRLISEVAAQAIELAGSSRTIIVVTGGEPMAQPGPLEQLARLLRRAGLPVHLETAGVHLAPAALLDLFDLIVVSPKLTNAGAAAHRAMALNALGRLAALEQTWFKFVVTSEGDLDEAAEVVQRASARQVMVMAEGTEVGGALQFTRDLADAAIERGWSVSPRLHIWLWGDAPGR